MFVRAVPHLEDVFFPSMMLSLSLPLALLELVVDYCVVVVVVVVVVMVLLDELAKQQRCVEG